MGILDGADASINRAIVLLRKQAAEIKHLQATTAEAERRGALSERERLTPVILEMAQDIEATINATYPLSIRAIYPNEKRRYERDMELPRRARALVKEG